jgi:hypothetical protein
MNFINNWQQAIELAADATSIALALPDGDYVLMISNALGAQASLWEVVAASVADGTATLVRGQEATVVRAWPAGSVIYCPLTAGQLSSMFAQLEAQASSLVDLQARVYALENPVPAGSLRVGVHVGATAAGYYMQNDEPVGTVTPVAIEVPTVGPCPVRVLYQYASGGNLQFTLVLDGDFAHSVIESLDVEGIGVLAVADATTFDDVISGTPVVGYQWAISSSDWADGGDRLVAFNFPA